MGNEIKIIIISAAIISSFMGDVCAESTIFKKILPDIKQERIISYNYDTASGAGDANWNLLIPAGSTGTPPTYRSNFSVNIPVKTGDYIEVMFCGAICRFNLFFGGIYLAGGSANAIFVSQNVMTWPDYDNGIWDSYTLKAVYRATADGTLGFRQIFWKDGLPANIQPIYAISYYATAEIVNSPVQSP